MIRLLANWAKKRFHIFSQKLQARIADLHSGLSSRQPGEKHDLGKKQKEVIDALRFFSDATNSEIAARPGWPISSVTPRLGELRKQDLFLK